MSQSLLAQSFLVKKFVITRSIFFALFCLLACSLTSCGPSNTVRLLPLPPATNTVLPAPGAAQVSVVCFQDNRGDKDIGIRRDGTVFVTADNVVDWVSHALADELSRLGIQVSYATTAAQARGANPTYIVSGKLEQAWIKETSTTEFNTAMRATYTLSSRAGIVSQETLSSTQIRTALPGSGIAEELLQQTLIDLVQPMAMKIKEAMASR